MNKFRNYAWLLALMLIGLFIFSCSDEDLINDLSENQVSETNVSLDLAKRVALNFTKDDAFIEKPTKEFLSYRKGNTAKSTIPLPGFEEKDIDNIIIIPDEQGSPAMYVVTFSPNGYIIISATKKESPILGFSSNSSFDFDNLPLGLAEWLVGRMDKIQTLKYSKDIEIPTEIENEWVQRAPPMDEEVIVSGGTEHNQVGPLLQTIWGQGVGYNNLAPNMSCSDYSNGRAPTGCVATAVAQVMRYHQHPSNYNWSIMPNIIWSWQSNTSGAQEVSTLMYNIGNNISMSYSCNGSGAKTENAKNALINNFGYSNSARYVDYSDNSVVIELNNQRPVIMDGYHTEYTTGWWIFKKTHRRNGHAWVCDGWRETLYKTIHNPGTIYEYTTSTSSGKFLHMNWGWNGTGMGSNNNNGWFKYNDFQIDGVTIEGANADYQYKKRMIIGIKPN